MSWVSDISGGVGDAVSSLVSGFESLVGGGGGSSLGDAALGATTDPSIANFTPPAVDTSSLQQGAQDVSTSNPLNVSAAAAPASSSAGSGWAPPVYQGALATGAMRLLGGALAPNPMAMQINAQDTWTKQAIARAKENQNVNNVVIPHVAPATPRKGLIGTNIH